MNVRRYDLPPHLVGDAGHSPSEGLESRAQVDLILGGLQESLEFQKVERGQLDLHIADLIYFTVEAIRLIVFNLDVGRLIGLD